MRRESKTVCHGSFFLFSWQNNCVPRLASMYDTSHIVASMSMYDSLLNLGENTVWVLIVMHPFFFFFFSYFYTLKFNNFSYKKKFNNFSYKKKFNNFSYKKKFNNFSSIMNICLK